MGRPRKSGDVLPTRMYRDKKSGMYYFVDKSNKYHRLGTELQVALSNHYDLCPHEQTIVFMADLIDSYMREKSPKKALTTHRDELKSAKNLRIAFGHFIPDQVTVFDVQEYYDLRSEKALCRPNRELSLLSQIFQLAIAKRLVKFNPTRDIVKNDEIHKRKSLKRERYITDEQLEDFMHYTPVWMQCYIDLKCLTGLRQTALLALTTDSVRDDCFYVEIIGKRGEPLLFNWTGDLRNAVNSALALDRPSNTKHLFVTEKGTPHNPESFKSAWQRAMTKALKGKLTKRFSERYIRNKVCTDCGNASKAGETVGHTNFKTTEQNYMMLGRRVNPFKKRG